jgi:hypothetical protein
MRAARAITLIGLLVLAGCGGVTFRATTLQSGSTIQSTSGFVSIVQFTAMGDGNGTTVDVTFVTLAQSGAANQLAFCGNVANQFPMNSFVKVNFTPTPTCVSSFVVVV